jgi:hypothetical protein
MSIDSGEFVLRRKAAAEELDRHEHREDGARVVEGLSLGLTVLRDTLFIRVHNDVQRRVGMDSMLMPVSMERAERAAKLEVELYEIAVSSVTAVERGYVKGKDEWYLRWLAQLRLGVEPVDGKIGKRLLSYLAQSADGRRLAFSNVLAAAVAESRRAPLVLFQLLPPAVQIVTALAFGDQDAAATWREQQTQVLPAIRDCHRCEGDLLDSGEQCPQCGNPLWSYEWLTRDD